MNKGQVVLCCLTLLLQAAAVPAAAHAVRVVPTSYPTIQAAVDAAEPGDTIRVRPGTYVEQVSIEKNVTLTGAGPFVTTIRAPALLVPGPTGRSAIVTIAAGAHVRMSNLTVSGPGANSCGPGSLGIGVNVIQHASLDLSDARILHIRDTPKRDCDHNGVAIRVGEFEPEEVGFATIRHVVMDDYQTGAVAVFSPGSRAIITQNFMDAHVRAGDVVNAGGVVIGNAAVGIVTNNIIRGNRCTSAELLCGSDPLSEFQGFGLTNGPGDVPGQGTEFAHNWLTDNDVGIYLFAPSDCCLVHHNVLIDNRFFGIILQDGRADFGRDLILGGEVGIGVVADAEDTVATLHKEKILGASVAPTREIECCGFDARIETD